MNAYHNCSKPHRLKYWIPVVVWGLISGLGAVEPADFAQAQPILKRYCYECHSGADAESGLNYEVMDEAAFQQEARLLDDLIWVLQEEEMPPSRAAVQPNAEERSSLLAWATGLHQAIADARPDDPGVVVMPRLNHREYRRVIHDLTGHDLPSHQALTPDSAAGEGFLNVGAAHTITAPQLENYLQAAKATLGYARITPGSGIVWFDAPQPPATTDAHQVDAMATAYVHWWQREGKRVGWHLDRVQRSYGTSLTGYLLAAWRYEHRETLGLADSTAVAESFDDPLRLMPTMVERLHTWLHATDEDDDNFYLTYVRKAWLALPPPSSGQDLDGAEAPIREVGQWAAARADHYRWTNDFFAPFEVPPPWDSTERRVHWGKNEDGIRPFVFFPQETDAEHIYILVTDAEDGNEGDFVRVEAGSAVVGDSEQSAATVVPVFTDPTGAEHRWEGDGEQARFVVQAPIWLRFPRPTDAERIDFTVRLDPERGADGTVQVQALDREPTSEELHFYPTRWLGVKSSAGMRRLRRQAGRTSYLIYPGHAKIDHHNAFAAFTEAAVARLGRQWPQQAPHWRRGMMNFSPAELLTELPHWFGEELRAEHDTLVTLIEDVLIDPDEAQREAQARAQLADFAERAWRRPVSAEEIDEFIDLYRELREAGEGYESAVKGGLILVLTSPHFLYRVRPGHGGSEELKQLSDHDLAERLSFMLWGSLPDDTLRELAASGQLGDDKVLAAQVDRLLTDSRSAAFALEFAGQWLQVGDVDQQVSPDPAQFPDLPKGLIDALQAEPLQFLSDLFRHDRSVLNVLDADYTFVNQVLAEHYGIDGVRGETLRRVELADDSPRGGVLAMAGPLAKFSTPLRTSPVKRGAWVVEYVLGEHLPAPPANVEPLSDGERNEAGQSIREQLEAHRSNPACFACHDRIDPLGIALEHFDALGRWRDTDRAGEAIDDAGRFVSTDQVVAGIDGLRGYFNDHRERFVRHFCEQMVAYALGRVLQPSDGDLIDTMVADLDAHDYRPAVAIRRLVLSQQFRTRRDATELAGVE